MADQVFNVALGRAASYAALAIAGTGGAKVRMLALKAAGADATLKDFDTVAAVLGEASTTEADFTNYARKDVTSSLTRTLDDSGNKQDVDCGDQTYTSAGGASNNTLTDLVFYFDPDGTDTDSQNVPLTMHDFAVTTDGTDLVVQIATGGFYSAS